MTRTIPPFPPSVSGAAATVSVEGSVIDGEWNDLTMEAELSIDCDYIPTMIAIVEFYRAHGPRTQITAIQRSRGYLRHVDPRQAFAESLASRLEDIAAEMNDDDEFGDENDEDD